MYRVTRMSGVYYAVKIQKITSKEIEEINQFVYESTPVIIAESLDDLEDLGIEREDIKVIHRG